MCMMGIGVLAGGVCRVFVGLFLVNKGISKFPKGIRRPLPEAINGILWLVTALCYDKGMECVFYGVLVSLLFLIAVTDFYVFEIPRGSNLCIAGMGAVRIITDVSRWESYLAGGLLVGGILYLVYVVTKRRGIGGGDVKMMAAVGLVLGASKGFFALFLGCLVAVLVHLPGMKPEKKGHVFAMGPYLAMGTLGMVWFGERMLLWYRML